MAGRGAAAARNRSDATDESARATRARLLEAAAEVFAEVGYQQAKIRDICGRAGANIALVNYHFGDKLGLYTEVLHHSIKAGHVDAIRSALDQDGPSEDILRALVKARMRGMCRGDQADRQFRIVMHELAQPTPAMDRVINEVTRPIYNRMLELIGGMVSLPAGDEKTRLCVHSVMGQIMLYALAGPFLKRLWPGLKMTPEQLDRIADHIADFSLAYLQAARKDGIKGHGAAARR
ncbi:MAG TPA: CerR family C-terminal domain-containing protein [Bryobacteraceae bacterium]|jgi:AcrR family transcriptional regulator|nr:CerR family C-terminal domain-containing protein [Bryobacteraceae bacterium]